MIDRTQEDINQDLRISRLEQDVREIRTKLETTFQTEASHGARLTQHQDRLDFLNPLTALLEHVEAIKDFITNIRSIRR